MEVLYPRCAGLDVHQQTVVACARVASGSTVQQEVRTFGTATTDLLALADWLTAHGCTHVAMESTDVYWKPIWHVLEGQLELIVANALQIRSVPGRKTDLNYAMWIADFLAHGLIRRSFVPPAPIHELRDLTRTRKEVVRETSQHTLRIQKVLFFLLSMLITTKHTAVGHGLWRRAVRCGDPRPPAPSQSHAANPGRQFSILPENEGGTVRHCATTHTFEPGRCRSRGRTERANRSLESRTGRGFPQRLQS